MFFEGTNRRFDQDPDPIFVEVQIWIRVKSIRLRNPCMYRLYRLCKQRKLEAYCMTPIERQTDYNLGAAGEERGAEQAQRADCRGVQQ